MPRYIAVQHVVRSLVGRRSVRLAAVLAAVAISVSACLPAKEPAPAPPPVASGAALAIPTWWSGACDSGNYTGARALGASYRGVDVCGPRPGADGAPNRLVHFFAGAWGELEWQCVELSMRFLYLAFGVSPYAANGKDVVSNYTSAAGGHLVKIANGTADTPPVPGDVISFGATATSSNGHTGVVASAKVDDETGDGTIRILSQNDTADGWRTLSVKDWSVDGPAAGLGTVAGWLHQPN